MAGLEDLLGGLTGGGGAAPDLGSVLSGLTGGQQGGGGLDVGQLASLAGPLLGMLQGGGLQNVLGEMSQRGLGEQAASWVGTGANQAVDPAQIQGAFGPQVEGLAAQAGLSTEQASQGLAQLMPGLVDQLTPDGEVPASGVVDGLLGQLGGLLGGGR